MLKSESFLYRKNIYSADTGTYCHLVSFCNLLV